jgi:hypothetical protein
MGGLTGRSTPHLITRAHDENGAKEFTGPGNTTGLVLSRQTTEHLTRGKAWAVRVRASAEPVSIKTLTDAERAYQRDTS